MHTVTAESFAPGTHAVVVMPGCSMEEALRLCINERLRELSEGCNMSPNFTLEHTGHIAHILVRDMDALEVTVVR